MKILSEILPPLKLPRISALMKSDDFFDYIFLLKVVTPNPHDSFMTQTLKGIPTLLATKNEDDR